MKKWLSAILLLSLCVSMTSCTSSNPDKNANTSADEVTVEVFAAASLSASLEELVEQYQTVNPSVTILTNTGSSGDLMMQIEEANGIGCDIFFSAAKKQVTQLEEEGYVVANSTVDLLNNTLCLVTGKDSNTKVTGWDTMQEAPDFALCDGTVPVGRYSRIAFVSLGLLPEAEDPAVYTAQEISEALGGVSINECSDVSAAASAVAEGSNEIGTVYYSDYKEFEEDLTVLAQDDGTLAGEILYPICRIQSPEEESDEAQTAAADAFFAYLQSEEAQKVYESHGFDIHVS